MVNGFSSESDALPLLSGVPVIGPLLFLIYIDGIKSITLSPDSHLTLYANNTLLYRPISSVVAPSHKQKESSLVLKKSRLNSL